MIDKVITALDNGLKTLTVAHSHSNIDSPAANIADAELNSEQRQKSLAMMRINHCGEVCAQALYSGQSVFAKDEATAKYMQHCIEEEIDHLIWCRQRILELQGNTSKLDPVFYACSFVMGMITGLLGDKISMSFVAASEDLVAKHLQNHLKRFAKTDKKSIAIVEQMLIDEQKHRDQAVNKGGSDLSNTTKYLMQLTSKIMTTTTAKI